MRTRRHEELNSSPAEPQARAVGSPPYSPENGRQKSSPAKKSKRARTESRSGFRFNRLLVYLFPSNSSSRANDALASSIVSESAPQVPTLSITPPHPSTSTSRPSTAPAAISSMPHTHTPSHSADQPLDIVLHTDPVILRGTGVDYEPATVRGTVRLNLPEATDIKEIAIRCTGKARLSVMQKEGTRSQPQTMILYLKEDALLEGDKSHPHTLKAGRHEFPFSFELNGESPGSLAANFGMAIVDWKLRALAVRPSFATNFISTRDFTVVRSFSEEALEFQQTLEIENTWPEKIAYTVILPHKAWAAGDNISAIMKFTPLAKGVKVVSVKISLQEKVKTIWRGQPYEEVRVVCSKKDTLKHGRPTSRTPTPPPSPPAAPEEGEILTMSSRRRNQGDRAGAGSGGLSIFRRIGSRVQSRENLLGLVRPRHSEEAPPVPPLPNVASRTSTSSPAGSTPASSSPPASPIRSRSSESSDAENENPDVEWIMRMRIPTDATPSHGLSPVIISHRVKWDVLISNLDGHYSELRCSLPVHLLAKEVLEETLTATNATRTALLGEQHGIVIQETVLPAYSDHVRDRVAFDELYAHTLAANPLNSQGTNPLPTPSDEQPEPLGQLSSSYGPTSTLNEQFRSSVPRISSMPDASERGRTRGPGRGEYPYLSGEVQSSELYLSLGRRPPVGTPPDPSGSQPGSQASSRAPSPERAEASTSARRHGFGIKPFTTVFKSKSSSNPSSHPPSRPGSSKGTPSAWIAGHKSSLSRTSSGPSSTPSSPDPALYPLPISRGSPTSTQTSSMATSSLHTSTTASNTTAMTSHSLNDYYDAVPEYAFAAQGFLGGGITPLSALRGLPSYDQAQRSRGVSPVNSSASQSQGSSTSNSSNGRRRSGLLSVDLGLRSSSEQRRRAEEERRVHSEAPIQE